MPSTATPEGLKEYSPQDLGRVLGLDRAPEVKTLRRKLARLATVGRAAQFGQALAQQRVALRGEALGFLYTDGHVRVYHGQHTLPKAHVARMRISLPATSDYWVNKRTFSSICVRNMRWMRWSNTTRCLMTPRAKFPTLPGPPWTPASVRLTPNWIDSKPNTVWRR